MQLQTIQKTMSSLEIAELMGKEHKHVLRDIENMFDKLEGGSPDLGTPEEEYHRGDRTQYKYLKNETMDKVMEFASNKKTSLRDQFQSIYTHPQNKQEYRIFNLPKRETLILISGYSVELRAKIIDRWEELENHKPKSQAEMLLGMAQILVDMEQKIQSQDLRLEQIENKVEKKFTQEFELQLVTPTQIGAMFEPFLSAKKTNQILRENGFQYTVQGQWVPTSKGKEFCSIDYVQLDNGKMIPQLLWQRRIKEQLIFF